MLIFNQYKLNTCLFQTNTSIKLTAEILFKVALNTIT